MFIMNPIYLHIFNRGIDRRPVFEDFADYRHMLRLFDRYLGPGRQISKTGVAYPNYHKEIKLLAFCLMPNHFHLELEVDNLKAAQKFMQSIKTAYCKYFNLKYKRSGYVFDSGYHLRIIDTEGDYIQISRYIHLNALAVTEDYQSFLYSSLQYYLRGSAPTWLKTQQVLDSFDSPTAYLHFHEEHIRQLASAALTL